MSNHPLSAKAGQLQGQTGGTSDLQYHPNVEKDNPKNKLFGTSGCDNNGNGNVATLDITLPYPARLDPTKYIPCLAYNTIFSLMEGSQPNHPTDWRFYSPYLTAIWNAPQGASRTWNGSDTNSGFVNDLNEAQRFYDDVITKGELKELTYIVPCSIWSDHPVPPPYNTSANNGPYWVGFIANTIAASPFWNNTTIIVTWDDWGGWYDNYLGSNNSTTFRTPRPYGGSGNDPYEYGLRVPLLVISPYAVMGNHATARSQGSILRLIEDSFKRLSDGHLLGTLFSGNTTVDNDPFNDNLMTVGHDPLLNLAQTPLGKPSGISSGPFPGLACPPAPLADIAPSGE